MMKRRVCGVPRTTIEAKTMQDMPLRAPRNGLFAAQRTNALFSRARPRAGGERARATGRDAAGLGPGGIPPGLSHRRGRDGWVERRPQVAASLARARARPRLLARGAAPKRRAEAPRSGRRSDSGGLAIRDVPRPAPAALPPSVPPTGARRLALGSATTRAEEHRSVVWACLSPERRRREEFFAALGLPSLRR